MSILWLVKKQNWQSVILRCHSNINNNNNIRSILWLVKKQNWQSVVLRPCPQKKTQIWREGSRGGLINQSLGMCMWSVLATSGHCGVDAEHFIYFHWLWTETFCPVFNVRIFFSNWSGIVWIGPEIRHQFISRYIQHGEAVPPNVEQNVKWSIKLSKKDDTWFYHPDRL